jgi:6-phosphogluconate dehydrogenase
LLTGEWRDKNVLLHWRLGKNSDPVVSGLPQPLGRNKIIIKGGSHNFDTTIMKVQSLEIIKREKKKHLWDGGGGELRNSHGIRVPPSIMTISYVYRVSI